MNEVLFLDFTFTFTNICKPNFIPSRNTSSKLSQNHSFIYSLTICLKINSHWDMGISKFEFWMLWTNIVVFV